jgi:hypothetical protein
MLNVPGPVTLRPPVCGPATAKSVLDGIAPLASVTPRGALRRFADLFKGTNWLSPPVWSDDEDDQQRAARRGRYFQLGRNGINQSALTPAAVMN